MFDNILEKFQKQADCMIGKYQADNCMPEKFLADYILEMSHNFAGVEKHYLFADYKSDCLFQHRVLQY